MKGQVAEQGRVQRGRKSLRRRVPAHGSSALADTVEAEQLSTELLSVAASCLSFFGVESAKVLASDAIHAPATARAPLSTQLFHDALWLGELALEWSESSEYLDAAGHPKILAIQGQRCSFSSLVRKYFEGGRTAQILELGIRTRVVERVGEDRVALINACVMLTGQPALMLARAVICVRGLLEGMVRNATDTKPDALRWPDRMACSYVPKESFRAFADAMRPQLHNVADQGNRWLSEHTVRDRSRPESEKTALMGVHVYAFTDD